MLKYTDSFERGRKSLSGKFNDDGIPEFVWGIISGRECPQEAPAAVDVIWGGRRVSHRRNHGLDLKDGEDGGEHHSLADGVEHTVGFSGSVFDVFEARFQYPRLLRPQSGRDFGQLGTRFCTTHELLPLQSSADSPQSAVTTVLRV